MAIDIIIKKSLQDEIRLGFKSLPEFTRRILELDIHEEQEIFLNKTMNKSFSFLHAGNRWGKGDIAKIKGAYFGFYKPVQKRFRDKEICILNTSISQDQANIVLNKFEEDCLDRPKFSWLIKDIKHSPFPHVVFKNKVVWWFRNAAQEGKFLLGRSYYWVNFDEADYAKNLTALIEEVIEPRTWDYNGIVDVMTTPKGKRNAYKLYKKRKDERNANHCFYRGDTRANKFIDQGALKKRIKSMPERLVQQNIQGKWIDSGGLITEDVINQAQAVSKGLQFQPQKGATYINAWDLARRSTYLCGITIQIEPTINVVSFERHKEDRQNTDKRYWQNTIKKIVARHDRWKGRTAIDKTGLGDVVFEFIPERIKAIGLDLGVSAGIPGKGRIKNAIIEHGVSMLTLGKVGIPREVETVDSLEGTWTLEDELRDFQEDTKGLIWDMVCALFIGLYIINRPEEKKANKRPSIIGVKGARKYGNI